MNYTLHQLQVFLKVVQTGSVTKAAEQLHLTQPAVSIQLRNLQDQFDIALTENIGRKIFITEFGKEIATLAENILNQVAVIDHKTQAFKGQLTGRVKVSVVSTGKYVMPYFLSGFMARHAGVELEMDVTNKSSVIHSLEQNAVDFALVSVMPEQLKLEKIDLLQNKLYLVGNSKVKLPKETQSRKMLRALPLIIRENGSGTRVTMERYMQKNNIVPNRKMELASNEAVKQAVLAGLGLSIMPLIGIRNELQNGELHILPIKGLPIQTMWRLIWLKGKNHSPVAAAFLDYLRKERESIVAEKFSWYEHY